MSETTNTKLKIIFYVHFILIVLSQIGCSQTLAYLFYNFIFCFALLWSLFDQNAAEPVQHAILINGVSILFDIIVLALGFPHDGQSSARFSAAMAIFNLVLRPFSILILHRILQERNGNLGPLEGVGNIFASHQQSHYQDIDRNESAPTTSNMDQDFFRPPAQQL